MSDIKGTSERTEAQILADLATTRAEMTATVDELFARVQPSYIMDQTKETAKAKFANFQTQAQITIQDAKDGEPEALKKVGIAAAGAATVVGLIVLNIIRKKH